MPPQPRVAASENAYPEDMSDDSLAEAMPTPDSAAENRAPAKRAATSTRKAAAIKGMTAPRVGRPPRAQAPAARQNKKRAPLKETAKDKEGDATEDVDEFAQSDGGGGAKLLARKKLTTSRTAKKPGPARAKKAEAVVAKVEDVIGDAPVAETVQPKAKRGRKPKQVAPVAVLDEEPEAMDVDDPLTTAAPAAAAAASTLPEAIPAVNQAAGITTIEATRASLQASEQSHRPTTSPIGRRQDASLERQLATVTRKLEAVEFKYKNLRELAEQGAAKNFETLKRQADDRAKAADALIASLRADLLAQEEKLKSTERLQDEVDRLREANSKFEAEKTILESSLVQHQRDLKTMHTKLNSARSGSASVPEPGSRAPGSAIKQKGYGAAASAEAAKEAKKQLLKEDLYGDLTGLLIRDVKRKDDVGEDVFDCIQTGRNGTLRFYLTVQNPSPGTKPPVAYSYSNAEFEYTPVLDENNDQQLISILPDYLTDEICFPRSQAAKFYSRIQDCLTKKFEFVDDEDEE